MGVTALWVITAHDDGSVAQVAARMAPLVEAERSRPEVRAAWDAWRRSPLPSWRLWRGFAEDTPEWAAIRSFEGLTSPGPVDALYHDEFSPLDDVWNAHDPAVRPYVGGGSKSYVVTNLFHCIGPRRTEPLPGWCGNFALTAAEVRSTLARVEDAFTFTPDERASAESEWYETPDEESPFDGPLRCWHGACEAGLGLIGVSLHIY